MNCDMVVALALFMCFMLLVCFGLHATTRTIKGDKFLLSMSAIVARQAELSSILSTAT
jgi:hypothetical protein